MPLAPTVLQEEAGLVWVTLDKVAVTTLSKVDKETVTL
jgi:hypothetical protein